MCVFGLSQPTLTSTHTHIHTRTHKSTPHTHTAHYDVIERRPHVFEGPLHAEMYAVISTQVYASTHAHAHAALSSNCIIFHDTCSMPSKFQSKSSLRDKERGLGCLTLGSPDGKNGSSLKSGFPLKKPNVLAKRPTFQLSSARCITNWVRPMLRSARARMFRMLPNCPEAAAGSPSWTEKLAPCSTQTRSTATAMSLDMPGGGSAFEPKNKKGQKEKRRDLNTVKTPFTQMRALHSPTSLLEK